MRGELVPHVEVPVVRDAERREQVVGLVGGRLGAVRGPRADAGGGRGEGHDRDGDHRPAQGGDAARRGSRRSLADAVPGRAARPAGQSVRSTAVEYKAHLSTRVGWTEAGGLGGRRGGVRRQRRLHRDDAEPRRPRRRGARRGGRPARAWRSPSAPTRWPSPCAPALWCRALPGLGFGQSLAAIHVSLAGNHLLPAEAGGAAAGLLGRAPVAGAAGGRDRLDHPAARRRRPGRRRHRRRPRAGPRRGPGGRRGHPAGGRVGAWRWSARPPGWRAPCGAWAPRAGGWRWRCRARPPPGCSRASWSGPAPAGPGSTSRRATPPWSPP